MRKPLKFLVLLALLCIGTARANAQDKVLGIIIELTNGERIECMLSENPKMIFDGSKVKISSNKTNFEISPDGIKGVSTGYVDDTSNIELIRTHSNSYEIKDGFIQLKGFVSGEEIKVYSTSGVQYASYIISSDGSLLLPLFSLPTGVSIIKSNKQSIKISKK